MNLAEDTDVVGTMLGGVTSSVTSFLSSFSGIAAGVVGGAVLLGLAIWGVPKVVAVFRKSSK